MTRRLRPLFGLLLCAACERPVTPRPRPLEAPAPAPASAPAPAPAPASAVAPAWSPGEAPAPAPGEASATPGEVSAAPGEASSDVAGRPAPRRPAGRPVPRRAEPDTGRGGECRSDDDCVAVPAGCCGCRNGGSQRAVSRAAAEAAPQCRDAMCPMVMSRHPSCQKVARCVGGACTLAPPPAGKQGQPGQIPDSER